LRIARRVPVRCCHFELDDVVSPVRSVLLDLQAQWHMVLAGIVGQAVFVGHLRPD
jgi:hypothetical protein